MRKISLILVILSMNVMAYEFHDSHFHLTNYVQEGITPKDFLKIMGDKVGRSTLFGIPLQQQWSDRVSGKHQPKYYLETDAHLYYYSFTDAVIASAFNALSDEEKKRFDPMITGFNPTDMYAADHIKRVLKTFPGVFSGIGEFTIHKEFVSSKVAGDVASLTDKAVDKILEFAGEVGLVVILHNDFHSPFPKEGDDPIFFLQAKQLLKRHPKTTIIWAHVGLGRIIQPFDDFAKGVLSILNNDDFDHVYFDISWSEVAKYVLASSDSLNKSTNLFNKYPDRFLFGTDEVAPKNPEQYFKIYNDYSPLWAKLKPETAEKIKIKNYERIFDKARKDVRNWEKKNL